eukprot:GAHX01001195.1.p1 GENE.GAHX01001195.1~~GAHX01001195.1.p1  ORF type:complete len:412 (-),score=115.24 GAHX01001195.1:33-1268(-)
MTKKAKIEQKNGSSTEQPIQLPFDISSLPFDDFDFSDNNFLDIPQSSIGTHFISYKTLNFNFSEMQGYRNTMEDRHICKVNLNTSYSKGASIFAILDGHGSDAVADWFSNHLPKYIENLFEVNKARPSNDVFIKAFEDLDQKFIKDTQNEPLEDVGSTMVLCLLEPNLSTKKIQLTVFNIGDSRAFMVKNNTTKIVPLTKDHKPTVKKETNRILEAGGIVEEERVDGCLALSRAFGDAIYKCDENLPMNEQKVIATADCTVFEMEQNDKLYITCDGLFECLNYKQIEEFLKEKIELYKEENKTGILVDLLNHSLDAGSFDNMSAIMIEIKSTSELDEGIVLKSEKEFKAGTVYKYLEEEGDHLEQYLTMAKKYDVNRNKAIYDGLKRNIVEIEEYKKEIINKIEELEKKME